MTASWIFKLNESDSRLHKESVIKQALEASVQGNTNAINFLKFTKYCYNPYLTFGVKQVPNTEGIANAENPWNDFLILLDQLANRKITGHAARDAIEDISHQFDSVEWNNFCRPILRKDLRAGISDKTFNKICKNTSYEIPVFGCQLATNCENRPEMSGIKRLEPKLDGVRVLMYVTPGDDSLEESGSVSCFSRNGKTFENFGHIEQQIQKHKSQIIKLNPKLFGGGFVLDGEVIGHSFQELMRQARRKENVQADDSVFNIFDIIPIDDFVRGHWNTPLDQRIEILEKMSLIFDKMPNVELLPHIMVNLNTEEGKKTLKDYANDMVNKGFEGIMIKNVSAPYECKRNTFWLKWKPTITVDLEVIGIEEGTGRNQGRLGALVCNGIDDDKEITVNVGSGFSDQERDEYWKNTKYVIGRTVEILADAITQNQDGTYSLRFPRFVRFRDDK